MEGRAVAPGAVFAADRFAAATYKPDGSATGPVGTLDILVEAGWVAPRGRRAFGTGLTSPAGCRGCSGMREAASAACRAASVAPMRRHSAST